VAILLGRGARLHVAHVAGAPLADEERAHLEVGVAAEVSPERLAVPLGFRGRRLGMLVALEGAFAREHADLLETFTITAAAAVATAQTVSSERLRERDQAAEAERRRWARELHDETLQGLAALRLRLASVRPEPGCAVRETLEEVSLGLQAEVDRLRTIIQDVRPSSLDDLGVVAALEALIARHAGEGPALTLEVDLDDGDGLPPRFAPETETALYRITQEALTNALKHSRAGAVRVSVAELGDHIGVRIRDDGVGFDPAAPSPGVGLTGTRERVELAEGRLVLESAPGAGTLLEARLPARRRRAR
jgi:signal transduction histidine kinase